MPALARSPSSSHPASRSRTPPLLDLRVAHKQFGDNQVLRDVHLALKAGEIVAVVGACGSGKSSLLRIAAGLDRHFDGEVRSGGKRLDGVSREIAFVFQNARLLPWLSVADNIAFDISHASMDLARIKTLLGEVGLAEWAHARPKELSAEQTLRASLARALYRKPRVLLLDEPFGALDPASRRLMQEHLVHLLRSHQLGAVLVTHDVDEATFVADRVLVIGETPATLTAEVAVTLPHPRERNSVPLREAANEVLDQLELAHAL